MIWRRPGRAPRHDRDLGITSGGSTRAAADRGSVTAELALALPAVVAVLVLALTTAMAAVAQVRASDAARAGARAAALGEDLATIRAAVASVVGSDASVEVERSGPWVVVRVKRRLATRWGPVVASGRSSAWVEPQGALVGPGPVP